MKKLIVSYLDIVGVWGEIVGEVIREWEEK